MIFLVHTTSWLFHVLFYFVLFGKARLFADGLHRSPMRSDKRFDSGKKEKQVPETYMPVFLLMWEDNLWHFLDLHA
jgi:hypothetical protein